MTVKMAGNDISRIPGHAVSDRRETGAYANPIMDQLRGMFTHTLNVHVWMEPDGEMRASTLDQDMQRLAHVLVRNGSCDDLGDGVYRINWAVGDYAPPAKTRQAQQAFATVEEQMRAQLRTGRRRG